VFYRLCTVKCFEAARKERFSDIVKSVDQDWWFGANDTDEDKEMEEAYQDWDQSIPVAAPHDPKERNSNLTMGMNYNRSFVARGPHIGVFRHGDNSELNYVATLDAVSDSRGNIFSPSKMVLHNSDRQFLLLNPDELTKVYAMDIETQKIVQEYEGYEDMKVRSVENYSKYGQKSNDELFYGVNRNSVFLMDPRLDTPNKKVSGFSYKKTPMLTTFATNEAGQVAVGSENGDIRLFSDVAKRAKTLFPGFGHGIVGLDCTADGQWLLATTDQYLLLINTSSSDGRTGFDVSLSNKTKSAPIKLQIKPDDMARYHIKKVCFTTAHFDTGDESEQWIVSSTGPLVVTWDFSKIKRGKRADYKIKECPQVVVADQFRYNMPSQVVVTMPDDVVLETRGLTRNGYY